MLTMRKTAAPHEGQVEIKRLMDCIHTNRPFLGIRRIEDALHGAGAQVDRKRVRRLVKKMGIQAIYPKPITRKQRPKHEIYPYLLCSLNIDRPNQVWATDVTHTPMASGFVYLATYS